MHPHLRVQTVHNSAARRNDRHDNGRRDLRQEPERRPASSSTTRKDNHPARYPGNRGQPSTPGRSAWGYALLAVMRTHTVTHRPRTTAFFYRPTGPPGPQRTHDDVTHPGPAPTASAYAFFLPLLPRRGRLVPALHTQGPWGVFHDICPMTFSRYSRPSSGRDDSGSTPQTV